ncbi:hypothetical protein [uncultured Methanobrevibacter sp.]|uniref:hypothetical protein n=1 Tax=uncultured Methanobrevibacter sp. TaxID=253161 RepID=UPI0025EF3616|nr:hypothetical protein [uncultured Methanobrevibacter sp.]
MNKFSNVKDNFIGKAITSLSLCSYAVYLSHTIVVKELSCHNPGFNLLSRDVCTLYVITNINLRSMYEIKNRVNKQQREKISNLMNGYKFKRKK